MKLKVLKQAELDLDTYSKVEKIGNSLFDYCNTEEAKASFESANTPGRSSAIVQDVILKKAISLGFQSEKKELFGSIPTSNLRPDYYMKVNSSGIIIEVERGKTIMNNMDMLDMWKCHLCELANHLFLFVPNELRQNEKARSPSDCFRIVTNRMMPFFEKGNYCNVHSLWIFGY